MRKTGLKLRLWWFEHKGLIVGIPILFTFVLIFSALSFDVKVEKLRGTVKTYQIIGSDFGNIKKLYTALEDGSFIYVNNPKGIDIPKGERICIYKKQKLMGNVKYQFYRIGECT